MVLNPVFVPLYIKGAALTLRNDLKLINEALGSDLKAFARLHLAATMFAFKLQVPIFGKILGA